MKLLKFKKKINHFYILKIFLKIKILFLKLKISKFLLQIKILSNALKAEYAQIYYG